MKFPAVLTDVAPVTAELFTVLGELGLITDNFLALLVNFTPILRDLVLARAVLEVPPKFLPVPADLAAVAAQVFAITMNLPTLAANRAPVAMNVPSIVARLLSLTWSYWILGCEAGHDMGYRR